jgi:hypothetical protein
VPAGPGAAGASAGVVADDEPWERAITFLEPGQRERLEEAMALAGRLLGAAAPRWQRLEAVCQEYLGSHPAPDGEGEVVIRSQVADWLEGVKALLEVEMRRWWFLEEVPPIPAPGRRRSRIWSGGAPDEFVDPRQVDEQEQRDGLRPAGGGVE